MCKITKEEILALKPGNEFDALITECFFESKPEETDSNWYELYNNHDHQYHWCDYSNCFYSPEEYWYLDFPNGYLAPGVWKPKYDFSASLLNLIELDAVVLENFPRFKFTIEYDGSMWHVTTDEGDAMHSQNIAELICKALLLSKEEIS